MERYFSATAVGTVPSSQFALYAEFGFDTHGKTESGGGGCLNRALWPYRVCGRAIARRQPKGEQCPFWVTSGRFFTARRWSALSQKRTFDVTSADVRQLPEYEPMSSAYVP